MALKVNQISLPFQTSDSGQLKVNQISLPFDSFVISGLKFRSVSIPINYYCFLVVDGNGNPIRGAVVRVRSVLAITNDEGKVFVNIQSGDVSINANGFLEYSGSFTFSGLEEVECITISLVADPCINPNPENEINFIRWHRLNYNLPFVDPIRCCDTESHKIANPFSVINYGLSKPYMVSGETTNFFANIPHGVNDADFSDWRLAIVDLSTGEIIQNNIAPLLRHYTGIRQQYQFYANDFTFPEIANGAYNYLIYNSENNTTKFVSNTFLVVSENVDEFSSKVTFQNAESRDSFPYSDLPIVNRVRINLFKIPIDEPFSLELSTYSSIITGKPRISKNLIQPLVQFEVHNFDNLAHNAMIASLLHTMFTVNNKRYVFSNSSYQLLETNKSSDLFNANFTCIDYDRSRINS